MTDPQPTTAPQPQTAPPPEAAPRPQTAQGSPAAATPAGDAAATPAGTSGSSAATTVWRRSKQTPLRVFLRTETGSAAILAAAAAAALIWDNASPASYEKAWSTRLTAAFGSASVSMDLRTFVNSGLMVFFFLVVGLEARRELDMGELRSRRRLALPVMAGLAGMIVPIAIFLAFTAGTRDAHGWGAAMSTDTAFALGALALAGKNLPDRVRTFLLTFSVVDDLLSLAVIAIVYSAHVRPVPLVIGAACLAVTGALRLRRVRFGTAYLLLGVVAWIAFFESGVDPIVSGLIIGLLTYARPAASEDLRQATSAFREFREQPTAELAEQARDVVRTAISPNDRLQVLLHPATSYLIVPLFALANADIRITGSFLAHAYASPVTLGIMIGYLAGKPLGITGMTWLAPKLSGKRITPAAGWGAVAGTGTAAGIGFTVSLLITSLAFSGTTLASAKLGILTGAIGAAVVTWAVFRVISALPVRARLTALFGRQQAINDLVVPVDPERDHIRGPKEDALITLVEYGDFECPYCGMAEPAVRALVREYGDLRFVFRHLPLTDVHPHAQLAAEAAEAAAMQDKFWEMHDTLMDHQGALTVRDLVGYARDLGLDTDKFTAGLRKHGAAAARVAEDVESADLATVAGTPTFFINGKRYYGAFDLVTLKQAVHAAKALAIISG